MNVTQQQAVPYQFFQGLNSGTEVTITWPDQYEGILTGFELTATGGSGPAFALVVDASGVPYAAVVAPLSGVTGFAIGSWSGFSVVPAGSVMKLATDGGDCNVALSGWLLNPTGSTILSE